MGLQWRSPRKSEGCVLSLQGANCDWLSLPPWRSSVQPRINESQAAQLSLTVIRTQGLRRMLEDYLRTGCTFPCKHFAMAPSVLRGLRDRVVPYHSACSRAFQDSVHTSQLECTHSSRSARGENVVWIRFVFFEC